MKHEIISTLVNARKEHLDWVVYADKIVKGADQADAVKPIKCTQCEFGQWYFAKGIHLKNLPGFKRVAQKHEEFHKAYTAIYYKRFDRRQSQQARSLFRKKKLLPRSQEVSLEDSFELLKKRFRSFHKETENLEKLVSVMNAKLFRLNRYE